MSADFQLSVENVDDGEAVVEFRFHGEDDQVRLLRMGSKGYFYAEGTLPWHTARGPLRGYLQDNVTIRDGLDLALLAGPVRSSLIAAVQSEQELVPATPSPEDRIHGDHWEFAGSVMAEVVGALGRELAQYLGIPFKYPLVPALTVTSLAEVLTTMYKETRHAKRR